MPQWLAQFLVSLGVPLGVGVLLLLGQGAISWVTPKRAGEHRLPTILGATGLLSGASGAFVLAAGLLAGGMSPARDDFLAWLGLVVAFVGGGLYCVIAAGNWRLWLSDSGLQVRNEWGRLGRRAHWSDIVRVRRGWMQVMIFERRDGGTLKIPFQVDGLMQALEKARTHGAAMDEQLLAEMAIVRESMAEDERRRR